MSLFNNPRFNATIGFLATNYLGSIPDKILQFLIGIVTLLYMIFKMYNEYKKTKE